MNARHLFRYARYALAALASVGFGRSLGTTEFGPGRDAAAASQRRQNRSGTGYSTSPLYSSRR